MAKYRRSELDLSTRMEIAREMLKPLSERGWGCVTELAQEYNISRTRLYELRDEAKNALIEALRPRRPGPKPETGLLRVDERLIQRMITGLPTRAAQCACMLTGSVRDIQRSLKLFLGVEKSVGFISETLQAVGAAAKSYGEQMTFPQPILGEADEIFQGSRPCLTVVDGRSFAVLTLRPAQTRDALTWGVTFLDLEAQGIEFHDLASDGARGIRAGLREAGLEVPLRPDLLHLIRDAHDVTKRLERRAFDAIETARRARRAEREAQAPTRRRGAPLKVDLSRTEAEEQEMAALVQFDLWRWLFHEARRALEPTTPDGHLMETQTVRATLETAATLLLEFDVDDVSDFARSLLDHCEELLAPLVWLEDELAPWHETLDPDDEQLILWAWRHREALAVDIETDFPAALQPAAQAYWKALSLFHRASSLAESLHSWLRPHLQAHRGTPDWLLPLLQVFWNHHRFPPRGDAKRNVASEPDIRPWNWPVSRTHHRWPKSSTCLCRWQKRLSQLLLEKSSNWLSSRSREPPNCKCASYEKCQPNSWSI